MKGILPPANHWLGDSPAGSPDGWRVTAGVLESTTTFGSYWNFFSLGVGGDKGPLSNMGTLAMTLVGPSATAGYQGRWLTALVDARFQVARAAGSSSTVSYDSTLSQWSVGVRPGVRLPLVVAALSGGFGLHAGQYFFSPETSGSAQSGGLFSASAWAALDAQPFCDWGLQIGTAVSGDGYNIASGNVGNSAVTTLWLHATYTPNTMCDQRRAGAFRIEGTN